MTYEKSMAKAQQSEHLLCGDFTADDLTRICRYLGLKPTPNATGRVNKAEKFQSFHGYYVNFVNGSEESEVSVHTCMHARWRGGKVMRLTLALLIYCHS